MPTPVSSTVTKTLSPSDSAEIIILPPAGVNLMALSSRLVSTCRIRSSSAGIIGNEGSDCLKISICFLCDCGFSLVMAWSITEFKSTAAIFNLSCPVSIRDSSASSRTNRVIRSTSPPIIVRKSSSFGRSSIAPSLRVSRTAFIDARGVLSSCEILPTNSCLVVWKRLTSVRS
ncbi:MAG: hypothetical protein DDT27_01350 [Dehalococcoidia bacterium]|nr:hypothetical protein [Chloroflexota bacterium]